MFQENFIKRFKDVSRIFKQVSIGISLHESHRSYPSRRRASNYDLKTHAVRNGENVKISVYIICLHCHLDFASDWSKTGHPWEFSQNNMFPVSQWILIETEQKWGECPHFSSNMALLVHSPPWYLPLVVKTMFFRKIYFTGQMFNQYI